jgi:gamma-glutamyltranspeptidase/glutathione hydrolase
VSGLKNPDGPGYMRCCRVISAFFGCLAVAALATAAFAGGPGQSAIASAHPLATQAGYEILEQGGNAFDASVAVAAALGVVEPFASGLGGGSFWLLHIVDDGDKDASRAENARQVFVDARETAPIAATPKMYLNAEGDPIARASFDGPLAAAIPGQAAGLAHIAERYGRLPLAASLAPAIRYAAEGFPAGRRMLLGLRFRRSATDRFPAFGEIFYPDGTPLKEADIIRQANLAETLRRLAKKGAAGFYQGETANRLVTGVRNAGGIWTLDDLSSYRVVEREPIVSYYRGVRIVSAPPPSSGGVAIANMLNILQGFDLSSMDQVTRVHVVIEAMRRAYLDRAQYLGDPDFIEVPVQRLTHVYYADGQRMSIRIDAATPSRSLPGAWPAERKGMNTTHFSVIDESGNRVASTNTINTWYGSGFMVPDTGVILNNEMDDFSIKPGVPNGYELIGAEANAIEPGKRPLSSMSPTFLESERGVAILGTPGGSRIISMVLRSSLAWIEGADAQDMVSMKRFHHQFFPDRVDFEKGAFTEEDAKRLEALGHELSESRRAFGNMNVVTWDYRTGEVKAASDPRGEGEGTVY